MIQDYKKRAIHRSKIIHGQCIALENAIENEVYCIDIMTQSLAIQKSLGSLNKLILENHLRTCALDLLTSGNADLQSKMRQELLDIYELSNNRGTKP